MAERFFPTALCGTANRQPSRALSGTIGLHLSAMVVLYVKMDLHEVRESSVILVVREGVNESRGGSEDCVGVGRIALFGVSLSVDPVCAARPCDVDDVQPLCHARRFYASRNPQPIV